MCGLQQQHTNRQLTTTPACTMSQRSATVSECDQTGFTLRRQAVQIVWQCKTQVRSMIRVQTIFPRPQFKNFSRDTVLLTILCTRNSLNSNVRELPKYLVKMYSISSYSKILVERFMKEIIYIK